MSLAAQQQDVTVTVLNAGNQPPQPVRAVRVAVSYLDSGTVITDAQQVTNQEGQALLVMSHGVVERGDLRVEITGASNLVIWQPADGQLSSLGVRTRVLLLPKGSPALLGPAQIEAMLHRTLLQVNRLRKQVRALENPADAQGGRQQGQQRDITAVLADFARVNGFPPDQVRQQVEIWAQNVQLQSAQATAEQRALAEFALKNYAAAAQTFDQAADTAGSEIDSTEAEAAALEKALLDKVRGQVRQLINDREQAAGAYQLALQYHQATQTLESAEATAHAEYGKHPDDGGFRQLWLSAAGALANARRQEGEVAPGSESVALLAQSTSDFQSLVQQYQQAADRQNMAAAQLGLANTLADEAARANADRADTLFQQARQNYQQVLTVETRAASPLDWANVEMNVGAAQVNEGIRAGGDRAVSDLHEAVLAYRNALEVYTRADHPWDWADAQVSLGIALTDEGETTVGDQAAALFDQSVQALRGALEVYSKTDHPRQWAGAEQNLAIALKDEGERVSGDKAPALFDQSIAAFQQALEVFTEADLPQDWAGAQADLGNALVRAGEHASGTRAIEFFDQAVQAFQRSLRVFTRADLPQDWARNQNNISLALMEEAELSNPAQAVVLFRQAAEACRNALQVFTESQLPKYWASAQENLGDALASEAELAGPDQTPALFDQAIDAWRAALRVYTRAVSPQQWAENQMNIMEASLMAARFDSCLHQAAIITDDSVSSSQAVVRDTMAVACQWGSGDAKAALATDNAMTRGAPRLQAAVWDFSDSIRFLSSSSRFATGRASWIALFTAVQNGDRAAMTAALRQLEPILQK